MTDQGQGLPCDTYEEAVAAVAGGVEPEEAARRLVASLTPEEKLWCLDGDAPCWAGLGFLGEGGYHRAVFRAGRIPRLGLPGLAFSDGPRGVVVGNRTCFPVTMARGATWDPVLEEEVGEAIGRELTAVGANLYGGVCVNLLRHPAWGRAQETYGEDPCHVGEMGAALTRGVQRHAMACVKHLACNSMENARFRVDVAVDEVALHEVYLAQFKRIVDEGVAAVMSAYNSVNGAYCGENRPLLVDVLRHEWGFRGGGDQRLDLRPPPSGRLAGRWPRRRDALPHGARHPPAAGSQRRRGVLGTGRGGRGASGGHAAALRASDRRWGRPRRRRARVSAGEPVDSHRTLARRVAARSVVLLRNEPVEGRPVLPLTAGSGLRVAVFGSLAAKVNLGDAGSSDVWALDCVTVLAGLRDTEPEVVIVDGTEVDPARRGPGRGRGGCGRRGRRLHLRGRG